MAGAVAPHLLAMPAAKKRKASSSKKRTSSRDMVVPGYTRTGGVYGRFTGPKPELKWFDSSLSGQIPYALGQVFPINLVPQGAGANQRVGRQAIIKLIQVKVNLQAVWPLPAGAATNLFPVSYRLDLILDQQANGANPLASDIYDTVSVGGVDTTNRFMNLYNEGRFKLLKRWEGDLNPPSTAPINAAGGFVNSVVASRDLKCEKRCNIPIDFSGTTGVIAEVRSANVIAVFSASCINTTIGTVLNANTGDFRIRFLDS